MKRGSKQRVQSSQAVDGASSIEPWVAWYRVATDGRSASMHGDADQGFDELDWVPSQLAKRIEVVDISDVLPVDLESNPSSMLNENRVQTISKQRRPIQRSLSRTTLPAMIYLASSNRHDPLEKIVAELQTRYSGVCIRVVLGEWWTGHRRAWPLAKELEAVYWYQCHDVLIPELLIQSGHGLERTLVGRFALVISEDSSIRQMWLDVLPVLGFHSLAAFNTRALPEGNVDVVFLDPMAPVRSHDLERLGEAAKGAVEEEDPVAILRRTYPHSRIVVCFGFPRWDEVHQAIAAGADFIVGKPFRLEGLAKILVEDLPA